MLVTKTYTIGYLYNQVFISTEHSYFSWYFPFKNFKREINPKSKYILISVVWIYNCGFIVKPLHIK